MDTQSHNNIDPAEAWDEMRKLLDVEMPANKHNSNNRRYAIVALLLLISSCGAYKLFIGNGEEAKPHEQMTQATYDSHVHNLPVLKSPLNQKVSDTKAIVKIVGTSSANENSLAGEENKKTSSKMKTTAATKDINAARRGLDNDNTASLRQAALTQIMQFKTKTTLYKHKKKLRENNSKQGGKLIGLVNENNKHHVQSKALTKALDPSPENELEVYNKKDLVEGSETKSSSLLITKREDSLKSSKEVAKQTLKQTIIVKEQNNQAITKIPGLKKIKSLHYGLEWNLLLPFNNNYVFTDVNAKNQPLWSLIPSGWVSKELSKRSSILFSLNPYAQYLFNKRSVVQTADFSLTSVSASNINQPPNEVLLAQTFTLKKITGIEAAIQYAFRLNSKWSLSYTIGNLWTNSALFNETIVRNKTEIIRDSLYGVIQKEQNWQRINSSFLVGKLSALYSFKRYQAGAVFSKPITSVYSNSGKEILPVNVHLFLRWTIK